MLACVKFGCSKVLWLDGSAVKEISEEEGAFSLMPSSIIFGLLEFVCVLVLTHPLVPLTWANVDDVVGSFEQMNLNTQAQSVRLWLCG